MISPARRDICPPAGMLARLRRCARASDRSLTTQITGNCLPAIRRSSAPWPVAASPVTRWRISVACHRNHTGPALVRPVRHRFAHDLLQAVVQGQCRGQCRGCHRAPPGASHANPGSHCGQGHTQKDWKTATFDHTWLFSLTGPHNAACITCHVTGNTCRYTCFGCHRHQPAAIRASHARRGIPNTEDRARCHYRGAGESDERKGHGRGDD